MDSATLAAAVGLRQNDYLTVSLLTLIAYDYVLTLPREIDYIWNKRWTMVSVSFILIRYCGLYILAIYTLLWSSILPGPAKGCSEGETLYYVSLWAFVSWIGSADLVMILRVWAMYNRSRLILGILLTFWVLEIISSIVTCIMYNRRTSVTIIRVLDRAYCEVTASTGTVIWTEVSTVPQLTCGAVICILVVFQFVKRFLAMYKATKRWHFNRYMWMLATQSILYFLFIVFFTRTAILIVTGQFQTQGWPTIILLPLEYVPAFALTPRFVLSIRALGSRYPQSYEIDAGFGLSRSRHGSREGISALDDRRSRSEETSSEAIPMEEWGIRN